MASPGRPKGSGLTRSRLSVRFSVWKQVRAEIAFNGAPNVFKACGSIIDRFKTIRVLSGEPGSLPLLAISDAATLRQWYAEAERARASDAELAMRCAAWEAEIQRIQASTTAADAAYRDAWGAGTAARLPDELIVAAAESARDAAPPGPRPPLATPRKNRRR